MTVSVSWTKLNAIGLGYAALGIAELHVGNLQSAARVEFERLFPNLAQTQPVNSQNNEWDAFRHAFGAAKTAKLLSEYGVPDLAASTTAAFLGDFREVIGGAPLSNAGKMDIYNNNVSAFRGTDAASSSNQDIGDLVRDMMTDANGNLDPNGELVPNPSDSRLSDYLPVEKTASDVMTEIGDALGGAFGLPDSSGGAGGAGISLWDPQPQTPCWLWCDPNGDGIPKGGIIGDLWNLAVELFSPLVLDLDNSSTIDLLSIADSQAFFDLDQNGMMEKTGWIDTTDGLLVADWNADGIINDGGELFGNQYTDGFTLLGQHDSNNDGMIDSLDDVWGTLQIWQDTNGDGYSQSGELFSLSHFHVVGIDLSTVTELGTPLDNEGNSVTHTGSFVWDDGTGVQNRDIVDVWFQKNDTFTRSFSDVDLDIRTAFLPTLRGFGRLNDTYIAASEDNSGTNNLLDQIIALSGLSYENLFEQSVNSDFQDMLYRWAGVDGYTTSRGVSIEGKKLAFLEELVGEDFYQRGYQPNPGSSAAVELNNMFDEAFGRFKAHFFSQSSGSDLFGGSVSYDLLAGDVTGSMDVDQTAVIALKDHALTLSAGDRESYWKNVAEFVEYTKGNTNLTATEKTWFDTAVDDSNLLGGIDTWDEVTALLAEADIANYQGDGGVNTWTGTSAAEEFVGYGGNDTFNNLGDGDSADGGDGQDNYYYAGGDVAITDSLADTDELHLANGITTADLTFYRVQGVNGAGINDLYIEITGHGTIQITGHFQSTSNLLDNLKLYDSGGVLTDTIDLGDWTNILTYGTSGNDLILNSTIDGSASYEIYGGAGNDNIQINNGTITNDMIYGGDNDDTIRAYRGDDTLHGDAGFDVIYGGEGDDTIYGGDDDDMLYGETGSDTIHGGAGNDYIEARGNGAANTLNGDAGDDTLVGWTGNDTINGGDGNDIIRAKDGTNTIDGGAGDDIVEYETYRVNIDLAAGTADIWTNGSVDDTISNVESVRGSVHGDTIQGDAGANRLFGNNGNDTINGRDGDDLISGDVGNDTLDGGNGIDTLSYASASGNVTANLSTGQVDDDGDIVIEDTVSGFENVDGSAFDDTITGDTGDNKIDGGESGDDTLDGGLGTDTLSFQLSRTAVTANLSTGTATGSGSDTFSNFENVSGSRFADLITGDGNVNSLTGEAGNDTLEGGIGNDTLDGGTGSDTASYMNATGSVTIDLTNNNSSGADGSDTLISIENATGSAFADTLHGGSIANTLRGEGGNDTINGWAGADILYGGVGNDFLYGDDTANAAGYAGAGNDTIYGDAGNDTIAGGDGDDTIHGGDDDDTIWGGAGADTIHGDAGDDTLYGDFTNSSGNDGNDVIYGGAGEDTIVGSGGDDRLYGGDDVDTIYGGGGQDEIWGDGGNDIIYGNDDDDILHGGDGEDILAGNGGADTLFGDGGNDQIYGNEAVDTVYGGDGTDWIYGYAADDVLHGGNGNDTIAGDDINNTAGFVGAGDDQIFGDAGNDVLSGGDGNDTINGGADSDTIWGNNGNDILNGDSGIDLIYGQDGNDTLRGGTDTDNDTLLGGDGNDILYAAGGLDILWGQGGDDTFAFESGSAFSTSDIIKDFDHTTQADKIDLSDLLSGIYDAQNDVITDFVEITDSGANSIIKVDITGSGSFGAGTQIATLEGVTGLTDEVALETAGTLVTTV